MFFPSGSQPFVLLQNICDDFEERERVFASLTVEAFFSSSKLEPGTEAAAGGGGMLHLLCGGEGGRGWGAPAAAWLIGKN